MRNLLQDFRYGLRMLGRNPGFTTVSVLTLALGIGANTAIFSVINGVLLRPLPYPEPGRIVALSGTYKGALEIRDFDTRGFAFWKDHGDPFQYLAADTGVGFNLSGAGRPERIRALRVSMEYFHVLGVRPALGRDFLPSEDSASGPNVAVLSNGLWKRRFAADPQAVGRIILLDGAPYTVVGVMPAGFESIPPEDLWTTIAQVNASIGGGQNYEVIGRLKPDVSRQQANAHLATFARPFIGEFMSRIPEKLWNDISFGVFPYVYLMSNDLRTPLLVLFGAVGFVLLIACGNVANLLLARAATRSREMAIRTALGASRARVFRQLLTESVLLGVMGGALGLLVANGSLDSLLTLVPADLPRAAEISLDRWALGFTLLVAVLTGIVFGLAPALHASRSDLNESLKEGAGRVTSGRGRRRLGAAMVSGEVALSLVLLVGSGLLIETLANLFRTDPGFDPSHVLAMEIWTTGTRYKSMAALSNFYESIVRRIDKLPGVESASLVAGGLPLERGGNDYMHIAGQKESEGFSADYREITPDYFHTLGVSVLQGRFFSPSDSTDSRPVAIINAAFARKHFPGRSPLGEHLKSGAETREIVGVTGDVKSHVYEPVPPSVFVPIAQASYAGDQVFQGWFPTHILVRTAQEPLSLSHAVEDAVRDVGPDIPIGKVRSMAQVLSLSLAFQHFLMTLMSVFAGLALVLASVGIYGVVVYSVSERTHEIGIRMALGAGRRDVLGMVVGRGMILTLIGVGIGIAGALALTRFLASVLYGVRPDDPLTFVAVSLGLGAVALAASYIPARRATKVDPMVALRYE